MAVITAPQLEDARRRFARNRTPNWTKAQFNAAFQAVETAMVSTANVGPRGVPAHVGLAIETAVPGKFTTQLKDDMGVLWCRLNAERGGIL